MSWAHFRKQGIAALSLLILTASGTAGLADNYFEAGVAQYKAKDYKKALTYFGVAVRQNPGDANALYYRALTYQALSDRKSAIQDYATIISNFPSQPAARYAIAALSGLDPAYCRQLTRGASREQSGLSRLSSGTGSSMALTQAPAADYASLPEQTRIYYQEQDATNPNLISVPATINGRPINMLFDTGADGVVIGKNQLQQLGIPAPTGKPTGKTGGVGAGGAIDVWLMPCDIQLGGIRRRVQVYVQESLATSPLLGQSFYRDLAYEIDSKAKTLVLKKKHLMSAGSANSSYNVHFERMGRHLIVPVEVNGNQMKMIFDTGASNIAFTKEQLANAHIKIPEDAQVGTSTGVAGDTVSYHFPIGRMRMGPIDRSDVPVSAVSDANMPYPLLGQTFYAGWQYTIDDEHQQIVFVRR